MELCSVGQFDDPAEMKSVVERQFRKKTMKQWSEIFEGSDACVSPVLTLAEAPKDPHNEARGGFEPNAAPHDTAQDGSVKYTPTPAPRLSASPADGRREGAAYPASGQHSLQVLQELGFSAPQQEELLASGAVVQAEDERPVSKL
ncbi:CoA-transferase family III [Trinorchestia longiramus]|nr:CoA-transferase family III [Trinorchestia longiramus]